MIIPMVRSVKKREFEVFSKLEEEKNASTESMFGEEG